MHAYVYEVKNLLFTKKDKLEYEISLQTTIKAKINDYSSYRK